MVRLDVIVAQMAGVGDAVALRRDHGNNYHALYLYKNHVLGYISKHIIS